MTQRIPVILDPDNKQHTPLAPRYISKAGGGDAPRVSAVVGGESDGSLFVTVDGIDYYRRKTIGAADYARAYTTGVVYHGDIPVTVDAAFLYKNG